MCFLNTELHDPGDNNMPLEFSKGESSQLICLISYE